MVLDGTLPERIRVSMKYILEASDKLCGVFPKVGVSFSPSGHILFPYERYARKNGFLADSRARSVVGGRTLHDTKA